MKKVLALVELNFTDDVKDITYEDVLNSLNDFDKNNDNIIMYKQVE